MKRFTVKTASIICAVLICFTVVFSAVPGAEAAAVYLRGTFNGWEAENDYVMTLDSNNHYLVTVHLSKGSYEYKAATADWSTFQAPVEGNETLILDKDCDVTFVADKGSKDVSPSIQAYPHSSLEKGVKNVLLKSKWYEHSDLVLVEKNSKVSYQSAKTSYPASAYWNIISDGSGAFYLQNNSTKKYAALSGSSLVCVSSTDGGDTSWNVDTSTGAARFISTKNDKAVINIENLNGNAEATDVPMYYTSSQWGYQDYTLKNDRVIDNGYNAYANSATSITSYASGSAKTWTKTKNLSSYPAFKAENSPLAAAVYNLTLEEAVKSIFTENSTRYFRTGTNWDKVWTRDTALSSLYSLAWVFPEISYNCERKKVKTSSNVSVFEQDTGTGGSYPVSTDKIITMLSVWENYLVDGNKEHLSYFYDICNNTIMQDLNVAYDKDADLFRGETCGLDWRDQTYPDWTSETVDSGLSAIAGSKTASVNTIYCRVFEIMSSAAKVLNKGGQAEQAWSEMAEKLEAKISKRLWNDKLGLYSSWEYPEYMGSVLAEKADVLGNGFALWFNIGTDTQLNKISENYPLVPYGADTVYPQKQGKLKNANKIYHNFGIWPGWESILMVGASYHNNKELAEEIFNSNVRGAATSLTQKEVINYRTGEGVESDQQLWSIAGSLAGYYRVLFGMNYDESGITFNPYIPDWMQGPFELSNLKYRNATLKIKLSGEGDKVKSFKVDGSAKDINTYVFSADSTGSHTVEIVMENSDTEYKINKSENNLVVCPEMPTMSYSSSSGKLTWTQKSGLTYKLWTGKEYVSVSGGSYTVDKSVYGCYSLMAVSSGGVCSELSKPIVVSPNRIKVEAENGTVSNSSLISNGYVIDKRSQSAKLTLSVSVSKSGRYQLSGIYNNSGDATSGISCAIRSVYVDGVDKGSLVFPEVSSSFKNQTSTHLTLDLEKGTHTVKIFYDTANWYDRNMSITKNDVEYNYFNFDYTGEIKEDETEPATTQAPTTEPEPTETAEPETLTPTESEAVTDEPTEPAETETKADLPTEPDESEAVTYEPTSPEETEITTGETDVTGVSEETDSSAEIPTDVTQSEPEVQTKNFFFLPDTEPAKSADNYKLVILDSENKSHIYEFTPTENEINGVKIYSASVPKDINTAVAYYQMYKGETWVGQISKSASEIYVIGDNVVKADGNVVNPSGTGYTISTASTVQPTAKPSSKPTVKKPNPMTVKVKKKTLKLKKLKKKAQKVKTITVKNNKGAVTYKLIKSGISKKIRKLVKINKKGVITIKKWKKAKKGTYKIKVQVKAKGNASYKAGSKKVTVKVKVK